ncbi:MAG: MoaD/ThiS family protein [Planctomycetota bacterium]
MIRVKVLLFASLAQRAGVREVGLDLPFKSTVADALAAAAERYPGLGAVEEVGSAGVATAVNLGYVPRSTVLADGDELALIPPVSGG